MKFVVRSHSLVQDVTAAIVIHEFKDDSQIESTAACAGLAVLPSFAHDSDEKCTPAVHNPVSFRGCTVF